MPNPICAAIGYFFIDEEGVIPLVGAAGEANTIAAIQNQHFAQADDRMETFFLGMIDTVFANPKNFHDADQMLRRFKRFLGRLFPSRKLSDVERQAIAEESIKTVFIMQFMDNWTFDTDRLSKCSCQHLLPGNRRVPSCGYYAYHRRLDPRFQSARGN